MPTSGRCFSSTVPPSKEGRVPGAGEESARAGLLPSSQPQAAYVHLASLAVLQGHEEEAQAALTSAIEAAPHWYRPRWLLAVLLAANGELRELLSAHGRDRFLLRREQVIAADSRAC